MKQFLAAIFLSAFVCIAVAAAPIRVVVWDERQLAQKAAYDGFLGDTLAAELSKESDFTVKSIGLNDPNQGFADGLLDNCDVLIWWGHQKHADVKDEHVDAVIKRLKEGKLGLIALHSAHWSKVFVAAMGERAVQDALQSVPASERGSVKLVKIPANGNQVGPSFRRYKGDDGADTLEVTLPGCIFPVVNNAGKPGHLHTMLPSHPIAAGIPAAFDVPQTEIYGGHFFVPKPDAMIFQENWDTGDTFTSGCAWTVGQSSEVLSQRFL